MSTWNPYGDLINQASAQTGVPAQTLTNLISTESSFNPNAVSSAGAQGLTQLMPGTAASVGVTNAFDPQQSITGGATYLSQLYNQLGDWTQALEAYNWGIGNVTSGAPVPDSVQNYAIKVLNGNGVTSANSGNSVAQQVGQIAAGNTNPSNLPTGVASTIGGVTGIATSADSWLQKYTGLSPISLITMVIGFVLVVLGGLELIGAGIISSLPSEVKKAAVSAAVL